MKISELIKELQKQYKKYGDANVEIQAYCNDYEKYGDRLAFFSLYPYNIDWEDGELQIYCEDCEIDTQAYNKYMSENNKFYLSDTVRVINTNKIGVITEMKIDGNTTYSIDGVIYYSEEELELIEKYKYE